MYIKIGILGAGRVAAHYVKIFQLIPKSKYKIITVVDINIKKAKKIANNFKCKFSKNFESILNNNEIDLILVLTPSGLHYEHAKKSLLNNFNVLVEKPLSLKTSQITELVKISQKKRKILSVAFQNRLNPSIDFVKKLIEKKKFGKIVSSSVRLRWCRYQNYYEDGWHGTWSMDGGVLNQQAIHHIDAMNYLLGDIKSVSAKSTNRLNKLEAEDTIVAILNFKDGSLGTFEATTAARPNDIEASLSITGEKGYVDISGVALNSIKSIKFKNQKTDSYKLIKKYSNKVENGYGFSHKHLILNIIEKLNGKKSNYIEGKYTIHTSEIIHSIYKSNELQKSIVVKNKNDYKKLGKF